jgi:hypothetical protein
MLYSLRGSYFSGFKNKDVAFLHAPSKTLMVADLIFNLPATEQVFPLFRYNWQHRIHFLVFRVMDGQWFPSY